MAQDLKGGGESRPGGGVGDAGHLAALGLAHQGIVDYDHVARQNAGAMREGQEDLLQNLTAVYLGAITGELGQGVGQERAGDSADRIESATMIDL